MMVCVGAYQANPGFSAHQRMTQLALAIKAGQLFEVK